MLIFAVVMGGTSIERIVIEKPLKGRLRNLARRKQGL